jgi:hypothetical protein
LDLVFAAALGFDFDFDFDAITNLKYQVSLGEASRKQRSEANKPPAEVNHSHDFKVSMNEPLISCHQDADPTLRCK